jgi:hypothetical protein
MNGASYCPRIIARSCARLRAGAKYPSDVVPDEGVIEKERKESVEN